MIYGLFIAAVLAFIVATAFAIAYKVRSEEWEEKYWEENRVHLDTQLKVEEANKRESRLIADNDRLCLQLTRNKQDLEAAYKDIEWLTSQNKKSESQEELGTYVVHRNLKPATPDLYRAVFELDINGQRVLEDLTKRFNRHAYVSDSHGGERETCRRLGQSEPVNFILNQINKANDPNYSEVENDA
ncbi:hypothetical protein IC766_14375 [Acinetobacter seifertii]|uniref:Bbp19 family protein n=1 Tax=Acinetobacter seifertii TaxID=1530123 RepID=UPI00168B498F|nr:hypothetical protein [Acinetobacter seifertii]QNY13285.1 hypothetical protein IC766_14375 [Acinetobacter seifertii]